jgi:hypothetical protein
MSSDLPYRVIWSPKAKSALKEISTTLGIDSKRQLVQLVRAINTKLQTRPLSFGTIHRSTGSVDEHKAFEGMLGLDFAVDVQRQFVLVRDCWRLGESEANESQG